ncbi:MAG: DUF1295 domain-containing protein [Candidatus Lokiarchaeota archaeon]|nr:DUF1295 domain-containing protein [Candidatus Lokiarchaeota archaeon]MCK4281871.1 DUF1295 domain-containing protein [Candidatus Lokiarchaeota archaeon]
MEEEKCNKEKKIKDFILKFSGYFIPILQYVPNTTIWFGIMSLPLIGYLTFFFINPSIAWKDFLFFLFSPESYLTILGTVVFLYSLIHLIRNRKNGLIITGLYKYIRHPQYLGIIIMTLGLTLFCLRTTSPISIVPGIMVDYSWIIFIWVAEVVLYIMLGKIEDLSLKAKFEGEFLEYAKNVSFMLPFLNIFKARTAK